MCFRHGVGVLRLRGGDHAAGPQRIPVGVRAGLRVARRAHRLLAGLRDDVAVGVGGVRRYGRLQFLRDALGAGNAVVAGVQGQADRGQRRSRVAAPHARRRRRRTRRSAADAEDVARRHPGHEKREILFAPVRETVRVEAVLNTDSVLSVPRGFGNVRGTLLRCERFPTGRLLRQLLRRLHHSGSGQVDHEHTRRTVHTTLQQEDAGHGFGTGNGRLDGSRRNVRIPLRKPAHRSETTILDPAGLHPAQRLRQHVGHVAAALADDRRTVPAVRQRHHGRRRLLAGVHVHIRSGESVPRRAERAADARHNVAVHCRLSRRHTVRETVLARNQRQIFIRNRNEVHGKVH